MSKKIRAFIGYLKVLVNGETLGGGFYRFLSVHACFLVFYGLPHVFINTMLLGQTGDVKVVVMYNATFFLGSAAAMLLAAGLLQRTDSGVTAVLGILGYNVLYLLLIVGLRLTGKRQIGELEPIELVLTMLLSDLASVPMQDFDSPLINGVVPILTLLALTTLLSYISFRSGRFRSLICGEPAIVVRCGRLQQRAMRHNRMTVDELMEELRGQGVTNLKDVKYAVLETSGQVSVLLRSDAQPVTPAQLSMNAADDPFLPVLLINDGRLLRDNMKKMDVDGAGLRRQLKREHLKDPSQVFLLSLDQGGNVICQAKEDV